MNYPERLVNSYATYDSDKRTNGIDDMESFCDAVLKNVPNYIGKHVIWRKCRYIVVGVNQQHIDIKSMEEDQSYGMVETMTIDELNEV